VLYDYKASYVPDLSGNNRHAYSSGDVSSGPTLYDVNPASTSNTLRFLDSHLSYNSQTYLTGVLPYFTQKTVFVVHRLIYNATSNISTQYVFTEFDSVSGTDQYDSSNRPGYTTLACNGSYGWKYLSVFYRYNYDGTSNIVPFTPTSTKIIDQHKSIVVMTPSLNASMPATVSNLEITLNVTHSKLSDLKITLISSTNKRCVILNNQGGTGQNLTGAKFSDSASISLPNNQANYSGTYLPNQSLSIFNGDSTAYSWFLEIEDNSGSNVGTIDGMTFINSGVTAGTSTMYFPDWAIAIHVRDKAASDTFINTLINSAGVSSNYDNIRNIRSSAAITNRYGVSGFAGSGSSSCDTSLVLCYSRVLTNAEQNQVVTYINSKFPYTPSGTIQ
jgi:subtilisin-like proprotein convertase family protein